MQECLSGFPSCVSPGLWQSLGQLVISLLIPSDSEGNQSRSSHSVVKALVILNWGDHGLVFLEKVKGKSSQKEYVLQWDALKIWMNTWESWISKIQFWKGEFCKLSFKIFFLIGKESKP